MRSATLKRRVPCTVHRHKIRGESENMIAPVEPGGWTTGHPASHDPRQSFVHGRDLDNFKFRHLRSQEFLASEMIVRSNTEQLS
jgi:hypothetical protein